MKTLTWDAINPITGTPFTWGDPNLRWGDPSYYLEPGDPGFVPYPAPAPKPAPKKPKPFRRKTAPRPDNPPNTTPAMPTFKYHTRQNPNGGFTTSVALGEPVPDSVLLAGIATRANTTPEIAEAVIRALVAEMLGCGCGSHFARRFLGILSFQPTSGGSAPSPDAFHNAQDINASVSVAILKEVIDSWQQTLTLEHMGEVGKITPVIDSMINQSTGALNIYTAGELMQVRGDNLKFNRSDVLQGIFLTNGAGDQTRCTVYADIEPQSFTFLIPPSTTGPQTVRMTAFINGSLRTFTYSTQITSA